MKKALDIGSTLSALPNIHCLPEDVVSYLSVLHPDEFRLISLSFASYWLAKGVKRKGEEFGFGWDASVFMWYDGS